MHSTVFSRFNNETKVTKIAKQVFVFAATTLIVGAGATPPAGAQMMSDDGYDAPESVFAIDRNPQQLGTAALQQQVLMDINAALVDGRLSPSDAASLKGRLNRINQQESWFKSLNKPIPQALLTSDELSLHSLESDLQKRPSPASNEIVTHNNMVDTISEALAKKHISSAEAENYFLRLAESESAAERLKGKRVVAKAQASLRAELNEIQNELAAGHQNKEGLTHRN